MNFLSKLFAGTPAQGGDIAQEQLALSHAAVIQYLEGAISEQEMSARLMAGFVIVPLAGKPEMEGDNFVAWNPAVIDGGDGSQWQVVFTSSEANAAFGEQNDYRFGLKTGTDWVLGVLPPGRGLVFNWGTPLQIGWSAEAIRSFKSGAGRSR